MSPCMMKPYSPFFVFMIFRYVVVEYTEVFVCALTRAEWGGRRRFRRIRQRAFFSKSVDPSLDVRLTRTLMRVLWEKSTHKEFYTIFLIFG